MTRWRVRKNTCGVKNDFRFATVVRLGIVVAILVALERVSGTLDGQKGTLALQHSGTMTRGAPQLTITVVPDSGTGDLVGLSGKLTIDIVDGKHSFAFVYTV